MIRPAKVEEIPEIMEMARACGRALQAEGIFQWTDAYPKQEAFVRDIDRGELWVIDPGSGPVGTIAVCARMDEEYQSVRWLSPDRGNLYIHRLGIHPDYQRQGLAQQLMDHAEGLALREGAPSVRLDTFSRNHRNQRFYEQRGYQRLGAVYFPRQSAYPFYCYERVLNSQP